jgi:hypothetical protein
MKYECNREIAPVATCEECGERIYEGDMCLEVGGFYLCPTCVNNMTAVEMLEFLDIKMKGAKDEYC